MRSNFIFLISSLCSFQASPNQAVCNAEAKDVFATLVQGTAEVSALQVVLHRDSVHEEHSVNYQF